MHAAGEQATQGKLRVFYGTVASDGDRQSSRLCEFRCDHMQQRNHLTIAHGLVVTVGTFGGGLGLG